MSLSEGDAESELVLELRRLAKVPAGVDTFSVNVDGISVRVQHTTGSSSSLELSVAYRRGAPAPMQTASYRSMPDRAPSAPRPLCIELRAETVADRATKRAGIDREVQTGDPDFDAKVYVDTRAPDEAVLWVLSPDGVREAVLALLAVGVARVRLDDDGRITAYLSQFATRATHPDRGAKMVMALARLVRELPWIESSGEARPDRTKRLGVALLVAAGVGFFGQLLWSLSAAPAGCVTSDDDGSSLHCIDVAGQNCCAPMGYGFAIGVPLGILVAALSVRGIRGRSNASGLRLLVGIGIFGLTVDLALLLSESLMWRR